MKTDTTVSIFDVDQQQIEEKLTEIGQPAYRSQQIWQGIYHHLWDSADMFTNLSRDLRVQLNEIFRFSTLKPDLTLQSGDHETTKTLFELEDHNNIEAVLMRYRQRQTICISTQCGCAMGCVFCATGQMGLRRHLSAGEIVEQVIYYARMLRQQDEQVTNLVLMGMGEPFHNYDAVMTAIDRLNNPEGFKFGERRVTISTVGIIPGIIRFAKEKRQINLAISLHAADDDLRTQLIPINKKYPLKELIEACNTYVELTHRRITFEWALIQDINDTLLQARELGRLIKGMLCHVNVICLNPTESYQGKATPHERALSFCKELERYNISSTVRLRRGIDIKAGCGQLAAKAQGKGLG